MLGCTGDYWSVLGVTGPCWGLLVHTGPYWAVPAVPPARPELELPEGAELPWREGAELEVRCRVGGARPAANLRLTLGKGAGPRVGAANPRLAEKRLLPSSVPRASPPTRARAGSRIVLRIEFSSHIRVRHDMIF